MDIVLSTGETIPSRLDRDSVVRFLGFIRAIDGVSQEDLCKVSVVKVFRVLEEIRVASYQISEITKSEVDRQRIQLIRSRPRLSKANSNASSEFIGKFYVLKKHDCIRVVYISLDVLENRRMPDIGMDTDLSALVKFADNNTPKNPYLGKNTHSSTVPESYELIGLSLDEFRQVIAGEKLWR